MALLIIIVIIVAMAALARKGRHARVRDANNRLSANDKLTATADRRRRQQATDELITVILPTINNDTK